MTINDAVIDQDKWGQDAAILKDYYDSEIFFELINAPEALQDGPMVVDNDDVRMPVVKFQERTLAFFYTTKGHPRLTPGRIAGLPLKVAISVVLATPGIDGMVLQSDQKEWIAVEKQALAGLGRD